MFMTVFCSDKYHCQTDTKTNKSTNQQTKKIYKEEKNFIYWNDNNPMTVSQFMMSYFPCILHNQWWSHLSETWTHHVASTLSRLMCLLLPLTWSKFQWNHKVIFVALSLTWWWWWHHVIWHSKRIFFFQTWIWIGIDVHNVMNIHTIFSWFNIHETDCHITCQWCFDDIECCRVLGFHGCECNLTTVGWRICSKITSYVHQTVLQVLQSKILHSVCYWMKRKHDITILRSFHKIFLQNLNERTIFTRHHLHVKICQDDDENTCHFHGHLNL